MDSPATAYNYFFILITDVTLLAPMGTMVTPPTISARVVIAPVMAVLCQVATASNALPINSDSLAPTLVDYAQMATTETRLHSYALFVQPVVQPAPL